MFVALVAAPRRRAGALRAAARCTPRPSVDLPQPDSPTRPTVSPGIRSRLTPSTARTAPRSGAVPDAQVAHREHRTARTLDFGTASAPPPVSRSAAAAGPTAGRADRAPAGPGGLTARRRSVGLSTSLRPSPTQRQRGHREHDRQAGEQRRPPDAGAGVGDRALEVVAPLRRLAGLDAEAEEAEAGERQDRVGGVERRDHRHALDDVAEQVLADDRAAAWRPSRAPPRCRWPLAPTASTLAPLGSTAARRRRVIAIAVTTMPLSIVSLSRKAATIASSRYGNANSASMISTRMRSSQPPT